MNKISAKVTISTVEPMMPEAAWNPGYGTFLAEVAGDGGAHGHDRYPGSDLAHVVVLLDSGLGGCLGSQCCVAHRILKSAGGT